MPAFSARFNCHNVNSNKGYSVAVDGESVSTRYGSTAALRVGRGTNQLNSFPNALLALKEARKICAKRERNGYTCETDWRADLDHALRTARAKPDPSMPVQPPVHATLRRLPEGWPAFLIF